MVTHTSTRRPTKRQSVQPHVLVLAALSVISSFSLGIHTAGDVETIAPLQAEGTTIAGDMDADGILTTADAIAILDFAQGYESPTPEQLLADPNGDGQLTVDDAIRLLYDIASF